MCECVFMPVCLWIYVYSCVYVCVKGWMLCQTVESLWEALPSLSSGWGGGVSVTLRELGGGEEEGTGIDM